MTEDDVSGSIIRATEPLLVIDGRSRLTDEAALTLAEKYIDEDLQRFIAMGVPVYQAP